MTRFRIHLAVAVATVLITPPAVLWWANSILFVILLSLLAMFYAAISAMEAADDSEVMAELAELRKLLEQS